MGNPENSVMLYVAISIASFFGVIVCFWCTCYMCLFINEAIGHYNDNDNGND